MVGSACRVGGWMMFFSSLLCFFIRSSASPSWHAMGDRFCIIYSSSFSFSHKEPF